MNIPIIVDVQNVERRFVQLEGKRESTHRSWSVQPSSPVITQTADVR